MDKLEKALEKARSQRAGASRVTVDIPLQPQAFPADENGLQNLEFLDEHRIVAHKTRSVEADIYRQLRTQVLQAMSKTGHRTLAITSPNYGDGKTTVAINLGISIALDLKQTVLLVDLDLRKPNLHEYLGFSPDKGFVDCLLGKAQIQDCLVRPPFERVSILPAGSSIQHSSELLGSPQMWELANELKNRYSDRLIIYDMPPVLTQDDPLAFLPQTDAVLVVVRDGVTKAEELQRCLRLIEKANIIGTVLNAAV